MNRAFIVTEETMSYTHCQFRCPWHTTCNRFRVPRQDDARAYMYFVSPPNMVEDKCEMHDPK